MSKKGRKETLRLRADHTWKAQPGCKIFVLARGAVRFDYPEDWVVVPASDSIEIYDKEPPADDCRLAVSFLEIPTIDWSGLPLRYLVEQSNQRDHRPINHRSEILESRRGEMELAWREQRFVDPNEQREACSLFCLGRKGHVQALLTFDFWATDAERCLKVWSVVLKSLELDEPIADPTRGRIVS
jgi:hypothetical protein